MYNMHMQVLQAWSPEDLLAVGIEPVIPQSDRRHELFRTVELSVSSKDGFHEFNACVLPQLCLLLAMLPARPQHWRLACFQQFLQFIGQSFSGLYKVLHHLSVVLRPDARYAFLRALDLAGQLNKKQPELAGHLRYGRGRAVVIDRPIVDPLAEAVGIKDASQQHNRFFRRIPVLEGVSRRDSMLPRVGLGGFRYRRRLLGRRGGPRSRVGALRCRGRGATRPR